MSQITQEEKKEKQPTLITFSDYQKAKENIIDLNITIYKSLILFNCVMQPHYVSY